MRGIWLLGMIMLLLTGCGEDAEPTRPNDFAPLTSIRIVAPPSLAKGTAGQFKAFGVYSGLFEREITSQVVWTSADETILKFGAPVLPGWGQSGVAGEVVVSATLDGVTKELTFAVSNAELTVLTLQPSESSRALGLTQQFSADGLFSDETRQDLTSQVAWSSSAPERVTIDADGLATTLAPGEPVVITASLQGISAQAALTVTDAALQSIQVTAIDPSLLVGETQQFAAQGTFSDGATVDLTAHADIEWTSSATTVATVGGKNGMVTAVATGAANITAAWGGISGSTPVQVLAPTTIAVTPAGQTISTGQTRQMTATATFATGDPREVTALVSWQASNTAVATVDSAGLVRGVAAGQTDIQATIANVTGKTSLTVLP